MLEDRRNKYSNSCVVQKKILNETKNHNPPPPPPPPLQVKWSVPNIKKPTKVEQVINTYYTEPTRN